MGSPAVSRFLYESEYSEENTKVKRMFGERKDREGTPPGVLPQSEQVLFLQRYARGTKVESE
jgi:hypothetical protein